MMSIPQPPVAAKLIISLFMREKALFNEAASLLSATLGPVDVVSAWLPFDETDYYFSEMGCPLYRRFIAFRTLIEQEALADMKIFTNELEQQFSKQGKRAINMDPGYLLAERFVLATGKNFTHRIYLKKGIYADLTLIFQKGRFRPLAWTYPDYAGEAIVDFLHCVRNRYLYELKSATQKGHAVPTLKG